MVVYELKDSGGLSRQKSPKPIRQDIRPASPVFAASAIKQLFGQNQSEERKKRRREPEKLSQAGIRDVKRLAEEINLRLEKNGAGIHLMLIQEGDGFILDVYDCTDGNVCQAVHEMVVGVDELQSLLTNLQKESGIIFDKAF